MRKLVLILLCLATLGARGQNIEKYKDAGENGQEKWERYNDSISRAMKMLQLDAKDPHIRDSFYKESQVYSIKRNLIPPDVDTIGNEKVLSRRFGAKTAKRLMNNEFWTGMTDTMIYAAHQPQKVGRSRMNGETLLVVQYGEVSYRGAKHQKFILGRNAILTMQNHKVVKVEKT